MISLKIDVDLPYARRPMIRFCGNLGNTFYLSDMSFDNNCIWLVDLNGRIRSVAGIGENFFKFRKKLQKDNN